MILQHRSSGTPEHPDSSQHSRSQCEQYHGRALPTMVSTSTGGSPPIPARSASHVSRRQPHVRCTRRRRERESPGKAFPGLYVIAYHSSLITHHSSLPLSLWLHLQKHLEHTRAHEGFGVACGDQPVLVFADTVESHLRQRRGERWACTRTAAATAAALTRTGRSSTAGQGHSRALAGKRPSWPADSTCRRDWWSSRPGVDLARR